MKIVVPVNSHEVPKNVALLFFSEDPEEFFSGAHIEVVQFGDDAGDLIEEKEFHGPLNQQIKSCLKYLTSLGGTLLQKIPGQAEVEKTVPYPYEAIEEALVNAIYHRSYEATPEPTKVYLYDDRMEIISYPGPVAGIQLKHFEPGQSIPQVPARNRRIGELLKELRLAESRGTGIPKIRRRMQENGSPAVKFDFDETHTYFRVILPVHPKYRIPLTPQVTPQATTQVPPEVKRLLKIMDGDMTRQDIQVGLNLDDKKHFRKMYLQPALQKNLIEMTLPDKPQQYLRIQILKRDYPVLNRREPSRLAVVIAELL